MAKTHNLFLWIINAFIGCTAFVVGAVGLSYFAIASDAHTWPYLSEAGLFQWQVFGYWVAGSGVLIFVFLLLKETLRRWHFDLDTLTDENKPPEPWGIWLVKTFITYAGVFGSLWGGTLLLRPLLGVIHGLNGKNFLIVFAVVFVVLPVSEVIRRWEWHRKIAARKPSHLA